MSVRKPGGTTAFDRLTAHLDETEAVCPACGYEDDGGGWEARCDGRAVEYRHACPSCGAVDRREIHVGR